MLTAEQRAAIARTNGARSKGPKTEEGKNKSRRNAITHGRRATALQLMVPPHSACLVNEDRQAYYKLLEDLSAKYHPDDETESAVVREIAKFEWKITRNNQMETALYNRELIRQGALIVPTLPELRHLEISIAANEALTGNRTLIELRKDSQYCLRSIAQLQRRLLQLQREWPGAAPFPFASNEEDQSQFPVPQPDSMPAPPAGRTQDTDCEIPSFPEQCNENEPETFELSERILFHAPFDAPRRNSKGPDLKAA